MTVVCAKVIIIYDIIMIFHKSVIASLLLIPAIFGCSSFDDDGSEGSIPYDTAKMTPKQFIRVLKLYVPLQSQKALSVGSFADEFESNSIVAEEKYTSEAVKLLGKVYSVDKSIMSDGIDLVIEDPYEEYSFDRVTCSNVGKGDAKRLRKNQVITVYGYVKENTDFGVDLAWCHFGTKFGITPEESIDYFKSKL